MSRDNFFSRSCWDLFVYCLLCYSYCLCTAPRVPCRGLCFQWFWLKACRGDTWPLSPTPAAPYEHSSSLRSIYAKQRCGSHYMHTAATCNDPAESAQRHAPHAATAGRTSAQQLHQQQVLPTHAQTTPAQPKRQQQPPYHAAAAAREQHQHPMPAPAPAATHAAVRQMQLLPEAAHLASAPVHI